MNLHSLRQGLGVSAVALSRYMAALTTENQGNHCIIISYFPPGTLRNPLGDQGPRVLAAQEGISPQHTGMLCMLVTMPGTAETPAP